MPIRSCAYCGATPAAERDHVPPKCLFGKPRPSLVTVPTCSSCHSATSLDDEYLRLVLTMRADVANHPDVNAGVLASALRSLSKPEARSFARRFLSTIRPVSIRSPAGLYIGQTGTYQADWQPVFRSIERTVRGLYFHHLGQCLGADYGVQLFEDSFVRWATMPEELKQNLKSMAIAVRSQSPLYIGRAFRYHRFHTPEDARVSVWMLVYFDRLFFLATTAPLLDPRRTVLS